MSETPDILDPLHDDEPKKERFKFRRVHEITGVFVLLIVAVLIAAVVWADRSQRWFKSNVTLRIVLPEDGAAGIRQGSEVYFLGTLVGSVSDVIVAPTGRMEAQTHIRHDFFRFVRADSSAVVKKKFGVAGDSFFEITRGVGEPLSEVNASIVCNEQPGWIRGPNWAGTSSKPANTSINSLSAWTTWLPESKPAKARSAN
jgi:hypothetical protein